MPQAARRIPAKPDLIPGVRRSLSRRSQTRRHHSSRFHHTRSSGGSKMRPHGQTKLGFFPLPIAEAKRLRNWLTFPERFSALDPCVGDGAAFSQLLRDTAVQRYGVEIDANRAEQARTLGIETLQANTMDVRCPPEAVSLLYLNPPYDWESGESNNQRLEVVFLEHTYRWLRAGGVLLFVIPQLRLAKCARLLSEQ